MFDLYSRWNTTPDIACILLKGSGEKVGNRERPWASGELAALRCAVLRCLLQCVMLAAAGDRIPCPPSCCPVPWAGGCVQAFCAGGDVKSIVQLGAAGRFEEALRCGGDGVYGGERGRTDVGE